MGRWGGVDWGGGGGREGWDDRGGGGGREGWDYRGGGGGRARAVTQKAPRAPNNEQLAVRRNFLPALANCGCAVYVDRK